MARILVTGATGFLGSALSATLCKRGHQVLALVRDADARLPEGVEPWVGPPLPALPADASLRLKGVDVVVHAAGRAHVLKESAQDALAAFREVNTVATTALARAAASAGVSRFVFVSSIGVNGSRAWGRPFHHDDLPHPDSPYTQSKWEAEQGLDELARAVSMTVHHIRPPLIYGAGAPGNFALLRRLVESGLPLPLDALRAPRSFVARENVVSLLVCLVEHSAPPAGVYLVSDPEVTSTAAFVRAIARAMRVKRVMVPVPEWILSACAGLVGRGDQVRKLAVPLYLDTRATRERLGWQPPFTMDQAMTAAVAGQETMQESS